MAVYIKNAPKSGVDARALKRTAEALLSAAGEGGSSVSISLVRDATIRKLNRAYRGKDAATDVLSFGLLEGEGPRDGAERLLGDVVISLDTARRQAADYDATLDMELRRLLIHGLLHLLGHDHERPRERAAMEREERRLARAIDLPWPY